MSSEPDEVVQSAATPRSDQAEALAIAEGAAGDDDLPAEAEEAIDL